MVPVKVRGQREDGAEGNRIVFAFVGLPVGETDPLARVDRIRAQTVQLKHAQHLSGSEALVASIGQLPSPLKVRAARLAAGPRVFNLTISNVPGPRMPLYVGGARVASIYPVIPLSQGHALAIGVLSYGDGLHFAFHADPTTLDEAGELPGLIETAISELEVAARARRRPARRQRGGDEAARRGTESVV